jgi:glucose-1-phosphate adenylyltransferase
LLLGADFYETLFEMESAQAHNLPVVGVGDDCIIENAIIDKNARIGRGVRILNEGRQQEFDGKDYFIRDGIVIVKKSGVIPDGTVI